MIIISWDVGVIHLAYCVLQYDFNEESKKTTVKILDWNIINLMDDRIKLECCGKMKAKKNKKPVTCGKNSLYCLNLGNKSYGFCKTHLQQHKEYWSQKNTEKLFKIITSSHECIFLKKNEIECKKISKYVYRHNNVKIYFCTAHYKSYLKKKTKEFAPQLIKNLIVKNYPTSRLQLNLINKLDELSQHFSNLKIEEVIIENQPSQKNPKMKSIANTLLDYFMIRGYIDKIHGMDIKLVKFICPSNKLKVNNQNTIEVFKANKDENKKYKLTKSLSIQYTKKLLHNNNKRLKQLNSFKKKDDLCDAYLQGRYYLEFVRNKNVLKKNKKLGGSKTTHEIQGTSNGNKTLKIQNTKNNNSKQRKN